MFAGRRCHRATLDAGRLPPYGPRPQPGPEKRGTSTHHGTGQPAAYQTNRLPRFSLAGDYLYSSGRSTFTLPGGNLPAFAPDGTMTGLAFMPDTDLDLRMGSVYSAGVSAGQAVYLGGKVRAAVRMAKIGATLAQLNTKRTEADVLIAVDEAFFPVSRSRSLSKVPSNTKRYLPNFTARWRMPTKPD